MIVLRLVTSAIACLAVLQLGAARDLARARAGIAFETTGGTVSTTRIPWNARANGIAEIYSSADRVWIVSRGVLPADTSNVWRVDQSSLKTRHVPSSPYFEVFAPSSRAIWGTILQHQTVDTSRRVVRVRLPMRGRETTWPVPPACQRELGSLSVTFHDSLWLDCKTSVLAVRANSRRTDLRRVEKLQAMLPARSGLWLVEGRRVHAVAGRAKGSAFLLPRGLDVIASTTAGDVGWLIAAAPSGSLLLVELELARRVVRTSPLQTRAGFLRDLASVGRELWAADAGTASILRFNRSGTRVGTVLLRPVLGFRNPYPFLLLSPSSAYVWAAVNRPPFALYRIRP